MCSSVLKYKNTTLALAKYLKQFNKNEALSLLTSFIRFDKKVFNELKDVNLPYNILVPNSICNPKLGDIIQTYSAPASCPTSCQLSKLGICYASNGHTKAQWNKCNNNAHDDRICDTYYDLYLNLFDRIVKKATNIKTQKAEDNQPIMLRLNIAGDIALVGTDLIDESLVDNLIKTVNYLSTVVSTLFNKSLLVYSYTHCKQSYKNDLLIKRLHQNAGIVINYSCDDLASVENAKRAGIPCVMVTSDINKTEEILSKELGIKAIRCANQAKGLSCEQCKLCMIGSKSPVLMSIHGNHSQESLEKFKEINFKRI